MFFLKLVLRPVDRVVSFFFSLRLADQILFILYVIIFIVVVGFFSYQGNKDQPLATKTLIISNVYSQYVNPNYYNDGSNYFNILFGLNSPISNSLRFSPFNYQGQYKQYVQDCSLKIKLPSKYVDLDTNTLTDSWITSSSDTRKEIIDCMNEATKTNFVDPQQIELLASSSQFAVLKDINLDSINKIIDQVKKTNKMTIEQGLEIVKIYSQNNQVVSMTLNLNQRTLAIQKL